MGRDEAASLIIESHLYLGPLSSASSEPFLKSAKITDVLSIGTTPKKKYDYIRYHRLPLTDSPSSDLSKTIDDATAILTEVRGIALVHCSAAISRSPAVVTGYLMKRKGMNMKQALGVVVRARPAVSPNSGFLEKLKKLDEELYGTVSLDVEELPRKREEREALFNQVEVTAADTGQADSEEPEAGASKDGADV